MRIALLVHEYTRALGHSRYVVELAERLRLEHEVHVFAHRFALPASRGITLHHVPALPGSALAWILSFYASASRCLAREGRFDVVHGQGIMAAGVNVITAHICNRAWFRAQRALEGGLSLRQRLFDAVLTPLEHALYRYADRAAVIAVSRKLAGELVSIYGRRGPTHVIPHGVDVERFTVAPSTRNALRQDRGLRSGARTALFVGDARKGLSTTLQALAETPGLSLDVVTRSPLQRWQREAGRLGLVRRVRFHPPTNHIERHYAAADLFVCPTPYDAFGLVITEAMAAGLPVVATRAAGAAELITHRQDGLVLDEAGDVQSLAAALRELTADRRLAEDLGQAARARARGWSWDAVVRQTLDVYGQVSPPQLPDDIPADWEIDCLDEVPAPPPAPQRTPGDGPR